MNKSIRKLSAVLYRAEDADVFGLTLQYGSDKKRINTVKMH